MRRIVISLALITIISVVSFCGSPKVAKNDLNKVDDNTKMALAEKYTPQEEYFIGTSFAAKLLSGKDVKVLNSDLNKGPVDMLSDSEDYVTKIGTTLALSSKRPYVFNGYRFIVLSETNTKSFAAPGGLIFITTSLLKSVKDEDELAAAIAYEIGHSVLKHPMQAIGVAQQAGKVPDMTRLVNLSKSDNSKKTKEQLDAERKEKAEILWTFVEESINAIEDLVVSGYSESQNKDADAEAVDMMIKAGYNPYGLFRYLSSNGLTERAKAVESLLKNKPFENNVDSIRTNRFNEKIEEIK